MFVAPAAAMRLSNFLRRAGCQYSYQATRPSILIRCTLQRISCFADKYSCICKEQPRIYWDRGIHSGFRVLDSRHSRLPPNWPLQESSTCKEQKRWATGSPAKQGDEVSKSKGQPVVYHGPFSDTLRKVKVLSLTTCCLSVLTGPIITFLTASPLSVIMKGGVAATVIMLSASTTAALHWFVGPYVHKLTWKPGDQEFEVEVLSWMATIERRKIQISDIRPAKTNRPFVTFAANNKFYFVDTEKMPSKELLRILTVYPKKK